MLRKDRERDAAFAWEVFQKAPYATLSLTDEVGKPYAIPISPVVDEAYHVVYFHCAGHGEKWELLAKNPPVCLSAVSYAAACPGEGAPRLRRPSLKEGGWKADDRGNSCRRKKCGKVRQLRKGSCCPSR